MGRTKKKAVAWLLSLCMIAAMLPEIPAKAAWDDEYQGEGEPVYGLVATQWIDMNEEGEMYLTEDGYPADSEGEPIPYGEYIGATLSDKRLWFDYRESVDGERKHIMAEELSVWYSNAGDPKDAEPQNVTDLGEPVEGAMKDDPDYEGIVDFSPVNGCGWYSVTCSDCKNVQEALIIRVDYPEIGFYSATSTAIEPAVDPDSLIPLDSYSESDYSGYMAYKNPNVTNTVYLNLQSWDDGKLAFEDLAFEDLDSDDNRRYHFELKLFGNDEDGNGYDKELKVNWENLGELESYFEVTTLTDGLYKLTLNNNIEITEEEGNTWTPNEFELYVNAKKTYYGESGEVDDAWTCGACLRGVYKEISAEKGLYVRLEGDSAVFMNENESLHYGFGINPCHARLELGKWKLEDGTVTFENENLEWTDEDITVEKRTEDGWTPAKKGDDCETDDCDWSLEEGHILDIVSYYQQDYKITVDGIGAVVVHPFIESIECFTEPHRPDDSEPVKTMIKEITVDEGKNGKIYVMPWADNDEPWATDVEKMEIKAYADGKEVPSYIRKGEGVKDAEKGGLLIGYEVEITNQAKEDFSIVITAPHNDPEIGLNTSELAVNINKLKGLKVTTPPAKVTYNEGEKFDAKGMVVQAEYEDGKKENVTGYTVTPAGALKAADKAVTITYFSQKTSQNITVKGKAAPVTSPAVPEKGDKLTEAASKAEYVVTNPDGKNPTVAYKAATNKKAKNITVPNTITVGGITYKVTSIADNAFKGNKKVTKIKIGSNITAIGKNAFKGCTALTKLSLPAKTNKIGKNAFSGCKKLKTLTIKSKKLTSSSVAKNAFKGLTKKTTIKVPKNKVSAYKKLFKKKGLSKKVKVKK